MLVTIRPIEPGDRCGWDALYAAYAEFYRIDQSHEMRDRVWAWLHDESHVVSGFVAVRGDGGLVGIIHYHPFPRPLFATTGCYIDDLFVSPTARQSDAALRLLQAVDGAARANGWSMLRGVTKEQNYGARAIYDRFAERTNWVVYERIPER